jgi:hypothetical protein
MATRKASSNYNRKRTMSIRRASLTLQGRYSCVSRGPRRYSGPPWFTARPHGRAGDGSNGPDQSFCPLAETSRDSTQVRRTSPVFLHDPVNGGCFCQALLDNGELTNPFLLLIGQVLLPEYENSTLAAEHEDALVLAFEQSLSP